MTTATQPSAMFYDATRRQASRDLLFLELVRDGLTRHELEVNIQRRPHLWARYKGWLTKLPY